MAAEEIDVLAEVRSGDVVLIPFGWHGPSIAVPGYDLYYLNVMAGPGDERAWRICDDPAHGWVRDTWADQPVDPRLPYRSGERRSARPVTRPRQEGSDERPADRVAGDRALPRGAVRRARRRRDTVLRRLLGHLRSRQRRRHRPGSARARARRETPATRCTGHVLRYHQARNEQAMVHAAVGYARHRDRLSAFACSASVGPGSTNMVTGAALATINRIPVLLLPGDVFATRVSNPVLQEVEDPRTLDVSVNDCFKPVSRFWDRINRPEQLPLSLLAAMRVLTDPAETGAVTLALPQDVQAEAWDWEDDLFARRAWHVSRQPVAGRCPRWPAPSRC